MLLLFITLGRGLLWDDCLALRTDQYPKDSSHECQRPYDWQSIPIVYFPVNIVIPCLRPLKASSLTVVDPAESDTDRHQVQSTMAGKEVLDTEKYPEIRFTSTRVKEAKKTGDGWEVMLEGRLSLHGVAKPISVPIRLNKRAGELRAEGGSLIAPHRLWHNTD